MVDLELALSNVVPKELQKSGHVCGKIAIAIWNIKDMPKFEDNIVGAINTALSRINMILVKDADHKGGKNTTERSEQAPRNDANERRIRAAHYDTVQSLRGAIPNDVFKNMSDAEVAKWRFPFFNKDDMCISRRCKFGHKKELPLYGE